MAKFWKDKRGEPIVSCGYYGVEVFDITYSFINIEYIREFRDTAAARKLSSPRSWLGFGGGKFSVPLKALWKKNGFSFLKFRLRRELYSISASRRNCAYLQRSLQTFFGRAKTEEVPKQVQNNRDWR